MRLTTCVYVAADHPAHSGVHKLEFRLTQEQLALFQDIRFEQQDELAGLSVLEAVKLYLWAAATAAKVLNLGKQYRPGKERTVHLQVDHSLASINPTHDFLSHGPGNAKKGTLTNIEEYDNEGQVSDAWQADHIIPCRRKPHLIAAAAASPAGSGSGLYFRRAADTLAGELKAKNLTQKLTDFDELQLASYRCYTAAGLARCTLHLTARGAFKEKAWTKSDVICYFHDSADCDACLTWLTDDMGSAVRRSVE